jgi:hypothetical protein
MTGIRQAEAEDLKMRARARMTGRQGSQLLCLLPSAANGPSEVYRVSFSMQRGETMKGERERVRRSRADELI